MAQQRLAYDLLPPCYLSGLWLQHRCFGIRVRDLGKQSSTKPDRKSIKKGRQINLGIMPLTHASYETRFRRSRPTIC